VEDIVPELPELAVKGVRFRFVELPASCASRRSARASSGPGLALEIGR
jgi:hypothetical protein